MPDLKPQPEFEKWSRHNLERLGRKAVPDSGDQVEHLTDQDREHDPERWWAPADDQV